MHHSKIAEFCSLIFQRKENIRSIKYYFTQHSDAYCTLSKLLNTQRNNNIIKLHMILKYPLDFYILVSSFKYNSNITQGTLELLYRCYYEKLLTEEAYLDSDLKKLLNECGISEKMVKNKKYEGQLNNVDNFNTCIELYFREIDIKSIKNKIILKKLTEKNYKSSSNTSTILNMNNFTIIKNCINYYFIDIDKYLYFIEREDALSIRNKIEEIKNRYSENRLLEIYNNFKNDITQKTCESHENKKFLPFIKNPKIVDDMITLKLVIKDIRNYNIKYIFYSKYKYMELLPIFLTLEIKLNRYEIIHYSELNKKIEEIGDDGNVIIEGRNIGNKIITFVDIIDIIRFNLKCIR